MNYTKLYEIWGSHDNVNEENHIVGWGMSADLTVVWFFHWHQVRSWLDIWNNQSPVDGQCVTEECTCFLLTALLHVYWWSLERHFSAISPGIMNIEISACHWLVQLIIKLMDSEGYDKIKSKLNLRNIQYHSAQNLLSFCILSR